MPTTVFTTEIVIPSYRRTTILQQTIEKIRAIYPETPICLGLQEAVQDDIFQKQMAADRNMRIVQMPSPSTTRTLNQCIATSSADVVLILDDDAVPFFGWLEAHVQAFSSDPDLLYTCGREVRASQGRSAASEWFRILAERLWGIGLANNKILHGRIVGWTSWSGLIFGNFNLPGQCVINSPRACNMAVRRQSFLDLGGFNVDFRGNAWGFEADFGLLSAHNGHFGRYVGDAIAVHYETGAGGSRVADKSIWFADYFYNHKHLMKRIGIWGWLGALPRLSKKIVWLLITKVRS